MEIENKKVKDLIPYEKNPRKNDDAVQYVANSIKEFGFKVPIVVDKNNVIVCGHSRYKASKQLGLEEVPCIVADDLTDEQIKAYRIADNKVSEKSEWDFELLSEENFSIKSFSLKLPTTLIIIFFAEKVLACNSFTSSEVISGIDFSKILLVFKNGELL